MNLKGYIASVHEAIDKKTGEQRTWTTPEGTLFEYFNAHLIIVGQNAHNEEVRETMCVEFSRTRSDGNVPPYRDYIRTEGPLLDLWVSSKEREHDGSYFNSLKLINARDNGFDKLTNHG